MQHTSYLTPEHASARTTQWDLQDLEDAVSIVEGNREKFATLDDEAVRARKEFIDTIRCGATRQQTPFFSNSNLPF